MGEGPRAVLLPLGSLMGGVAEGWRRECGDFPPQVSQDLPVASSPGLSWPLSARMLIPPGQGWNRRVLVSIICTCISALAIGQTIKDTIFTQLTGGSNIGPLILCPLDFHGLNLNGF